MVQIKELKQWYIADVFDLKKIPYSIKEQQDMKAARKQRNANNANINSQRQQTQNGSHSPKTTPTIQESFKNAKTEKLETIAKDVAKDIAAEVQMQMPCSQEKAMFESCRSLI